MADLKYRSLYPVLTVGLSMVGFILIKTGRDAVFFQENGLYQLPLAYIYIAILSVFAGMAHLWAIKRWGARKTRTGVFFVASAAFALFVPFVSETQRTMMTAMFVFVPTIFAALFAGAWLLSGDILEGADSETLRRAYSRIGAGSMIGGILGGTFAKGLLLFFGPKYLIAGGAGVLTMVGLMVSRVHQKYPVQDFATNKQNQQGEKETGSMGDLVNLQSHLLKNPYIRTLLGISGVATLVALFIDFQFYASTMISGNNNARYFANFYILLNAGTLVLQLFFTPLLQSALGAGGVLMLFPLTLLGPAGIGSFVGTLQARSVLKMAEAGLKASVYRSVWEQAYLPIQRAWRDTVKVVVDGMFARMSEGVGAVVLYIWLSRTSSELSNLDLSWISYMIIGLLLIWIGLVRFLNTMCGSEVEAEEIEIRLPESCPVVSNMGKGMKR